jgi:predicted nucleic acid-binding protein
MPPVLFDTSVYISAFRAGTDSFLALRRLLSGSPIWLSAVVLQELYAGTEARDSKAIQRMEREFERISRILIPNLKDWTLCGKVLARMAVKYDLEQVGQSRLTNDCLIAVGRGVTVLTENQRDFERLAGFCDFSWRILSFP